MKAKELVQKIQDSLCDDAEVDFLLIDGTDLAWLDLRNVNMNDGEDLYYEYGAGCIDDPNNANRVGLTFFIRERF